MLEQNLFNLTEKYNIFMNIDHEDKERFKGIISWAGEMMEMTVMEKYTRSITPLRCEIWTCNFGENVGSEVNKVRPALIISDDLGNCKSKTVTILPITSKVARQDTHVTIEDSDLLFVENAIKGTITTEGIRNVSKARLGRRIGKVNLECMARVEQAIRRALGFIEPPIVIDHEDVPTEEQLLQTDEENHLIESPESEQVQETVADVPSEEIKQEKEELSPQELRKLTKKERYLKKQKNKLNRKRH